MPSLKTPILAVNTNVMHHIDTRNAKCLFTMWTLFSKCSGSIEEGCRLENLSWRLWNKEISCAHTQANSSTPAIPISDIPDLSRSVESIDDEAVEQSTCTTVPLITRCRVRQQVSDFSRGPGKERHITPDDLEEMVISIIEKRDLEQLALDMCSPLALLPRKTTPRQLSNSVSHITRDQLLEQISSALALSTKLPVSKVNDTGSATSDRSLTSAIRGLPPSQAPSSYRSRPLLRAPAWVHGPTLPNKYALFDPGDLSHSHNVSYKQSSLDCRVVQTKGKRGCASPFQLGGSASEGENSIRANLQRHQSSLSVNLRRSSASNKQAFVKAKVATRTINENQVAIGEVFDTDDVIDESAIDDSSDWEDSIEVSGKSGAEERSLQESGRSSAEKKLTFYRVDPPHNLAPHRSLITAMLHQNDRAAALETDAFRSALVQPSVAHLTKPDDGQPLSSKTIRRQMLVTELTAKLRRHLLWERQEKNRTVSAVLKRYCSAHGGTIFKQCFERVNVGDHEGWNQYFVQGQGDYHSNGCTTIEEVEKGRGLRCQAAHCEHTHSSNRRQRG
ncbi:hypothetical protein V495_01767 [Pseudogymnoascus sp. VKM F-4514 (FW-929)]|nr:hypothetical protein V495_01767 [Pseudogymnoascus sp. VKM F-4514 (FW-929)]KFY59260.1 hypothetical protein V497_04413 [Pseudogymnoascus sp. VKM F-4516 (FW-969)]